MITKGEKKRVSLFAVLMVLASTMCSAQQMEWVELGTGKASTASTSTYIPSDSAKGPVCAVRLQLQGPGFEVEALTVHFANGQSMHFSMDDKVGKDGATKVTVLPGQPRAVRGLDVVYRRLDPMLPVPTIDLMGGTIVNVATVGVCPRAKN